MKRLIAALALLAGCVAPPAGSPATAPAAPSPTSAAPSVLPSAPGAVAPEPAPATKPSPVPSVPSLLPWNRLPDLPASLPLKQAAVWARSVQDVYAVTGGNELWHTNGTAWTRQTVDGAGNLIALTGDTTSVWATTDAGYLLKVTGGAITRQRVLDGPAPGVAHIKGDQLLVACADGNEPAKLVTGSAIVPQTGLRRKGYAVAARNDKLWIAGADGFIASRRLDRDQWTVTELGSSEALRAIAIYTGGRSPLDAMIVGDSGAAVRDSSGPPMTPFGTGTRVRLNGVAATVADGIFAVADGGLILFFDSDAWRVLVQEAQLGNVLAITALGRREMIIVCANGQVYAGPYGILR